MLEPSSFSHWMEAVCADVREPPLRRLFALFKCSAASPCVSSYPSIDPPSLPSDEFFGNDNGKSARPLEGHEPLC